jgi:hypothetical protein
MLKTVSSIANAIGALNFKGTWNASANTPALASGVGTKGDYYQVSVAGSTSLDGLSNWGVGDVVAFNGTTWQRIEGGADLNGVNLSVTGTSTLDGQITQQTRVIRAVKSVSLADNSASTLFTVTTPDPAGSNDGGTYACRVFLLASFTGSGSGAAAGAIASKSQEVMFTVANGSPGTVARSAVVTMHTTARADPGGFTDLTDPVVTLNGVSNYVTNVQITSDGQGVVSAGQMTAIIELVYTNYATAPVIS